MRPLHDYVLIEVEDRFERKTGVKGLDGQDLELAIDEEDDYVANQRVKTYGTVVAVPDYLSKFPMAQETTGSPHYVDNRKFQYKYRSDIEMEVKVGDKIYFHHNTLFADAGKKNLIHTDGKKSIYMVAYESIQCALRKSGGRTVKDDKGIVVDYETYFDVIMIGGYCLIRPDIESWKDITIPTYETANGQPLVDSQGQKILRPENKWIQKKEKPEAKSLLGYVVAVGSPLKGYVTELSPEDHIVYRRNADWEVTIEGQMYYMIRQRNIIAKVW